MISKRANGWLNSEYGLMEGMKLAFENPFDISTRPQGCINLGAAENELMFDMLQQKVSSSHSLLNVKPIDIKYNDFSGILELREATAKFLTRFIGACDIEANDISYHNGCGSAVESLFHVLCDEGDVVIVPAPYYGGFDMDLERRGRVKIVPVQTRFEDGHQITQEALEDAYKEAIGVAKENGSRVVGLLIVNPVNPLGVIYDCELMSMMSDFCACYKLHFIVDEIYAFSIFKNHNKFKSILSRKDIIEKNKDRVHFLWGFSKDFCVNGFRVGLLASKNAQVIAGVKELSYFTGISTLMQSLVLEFVGDLDWSERFFNTNQQRLLECYNHVTNAIHAFNAKSTKKKIRFLEAEAGFFIWLDFRDFIECPATEQAERDLFMQLIKQSHVYIAPGNMAFHAKECGTFRMIFAARKEVLDMALKRIFDTLR